MSDTDKNILSQPISDEALSDVAGGAIVDGFCMGHQTNYNSYDQDWDNCTSISKRNIYGGNGFPNCAASVEDGSWCGNTDACFSEAIDYQGMKNCYKALE